MKKKQMLLVMLVSLLALSFTFLSCGDDEEETTQGSTQGSAQGLKGTSSVYGYTKAEFAAQMEITEAEFDALLAQYGVTINFPIQMMKIVFSSDKNFEWYSNDAIDFFSTPDWEVIYTGTYTVSGNNVTLNTVEDGEAVSLTCTLSGNTLTMSFEGQSRTFQKQ
jgi:hypothetical protein